jgi:hypothetical protein
VSSYPVLDGREETWEPRHTATIPLIFMQTFQQSLHESITAWHARKELERLRQSRFSSVAEAHSYGWHAVRVQVQSARFRSKVLNNNDSLLHYQSTSSESLSSTTSALTTNPAPPPVPGSAQLPFYQLHFPVSSQFFEPEETSQRISTQSVSASQKRPSSNLCAPTTRKSIFGGNGIVVKKFDENMPSSYVEIYVQDE